VTVACCEASDWRRGSKVMVWWSDRHNTVAAKKVGDAEGERTKSSVRTQPRSQRAARGAKAREWLARITAIRKPQKMVVQLSVGS